MNEIQNYLDYFVSKGLPCPNQFLKLKGGRNNLIFRLIFDSSEDLVLKIYPQVDIIKKFRLNREWLFSKYLVKKGVNIIPNPILCSFEKSSAIFEYIPGKKLSSKRINKTHIKLAADFIVQINKNISNEQPKLLNASEACFSLSEHIIIINKRISNIIKILPKNKTNRDFNILVEEFLIPIWKKIKWQAKNNAFYKDKIVKKFISPSDFGFHNILYNNNKLHFLDFEHAGYDDLSKLVNDFFLSPEIKIDEKYRSFFISEIQKGLGLDDDFKIRCEILKNICIIKWVCIILNNFSPEMDFRIRKAILGIRKQERQNLQIKKAYEMIKKINHFI